MNTNPFKISGYFGPNYFCDRENETERLLSAIENHRHLTLFSLRRMGKSGLIWHVFDHLGKKNKKTTTVYIDLMPTTNLHDFTQTLANAVLSNIAQKQSLIKKIMTTMALLRPTLSYDPLTGAPEVSVKLDSQSIEHSLETIFTLLESQDHHFAIALDEFQQIAIYPEKQTEALLRSYIQKLNNATFIFSGSRKHILTEIFSSPTRPFFNSTEKMEIGAIDSDTYKAFIDFHFHSTKLKILPEALDTIEKLTDMHTYFVQFICNRLYGTSKKIIDHIDTELMFRQIVEENESIYANYLNLITPMQFRLLKALSRDNGSEMITSKEFLNSNNLGAASSVKTAAKSLVDKDFIFIENDKYFLIDKFLKGWLASLK
jgi:uncharacterized protein